MNREEKKQLVGDLKEELESSAMIVLVHYHGLNDSSINQIRGELRSNQCTMRVAKNTLTKIAISNSKLDVLDQYLQGPIALIYSQEAVSLAKTLNKSLKENQSLKLIAGYFNEKVVNENEISNLAKLGSIDEVRISFLGNIKGVQSKFVRVLNSHQTGLTSLIKNYASSKEGS